MVHSRRPTVICILGMHRSGTSAVARLLNLLGMYLGREERLMPPKEDNPAGFWEHLGFFEINEEILKHFGGSWFDPPQFPAGWETLPEMSGLRKRACALVKEEFEGARIWGWKDPRNCLTLPFWQRVIPGMRYVLCLRNPLEVAASLDKRDGLPEARSARLWLDYSVGSFLHTFQKPRLITFYEDYFPHWDRELKRLAQFARLKVPPRGSALYGEMDEFVQGERRHYQSSVLDAMDREDLGFPSKALYLTLRTSVSNARGRGPESKVAPDDVIDAFIRGLQAHQSEVHRLAEEAAQVARLTAERERLTQETAELQGTVRAQQQTLAQRDGLINQIAAEKERLSQLAQTVNNSLGWYLITKHYAVKAKLMPSGTRRRTVYDLLLKGIKTIVFEGRSSFALKVKNKLGSLKRTRFRVAKDPLSRARRDVRAPLVFKRVDEPRVSIVIPVFNKASYTYQCLTSILEHTPSDLYEIMVVDNASTDDTPQMLREIENIKVIVNSENLGYVEGCNKGSTAAAGEYVLFLNNDTVVTEGWLTSLLGTFDKHERIGAVGAKLLYPDGRLQEAGGIIWNDGTGWNYGRGDDPHRPEYQYLREVDYCSGACLLVRRELFEQLGGFDPCYAPAYYEDTDLCFEMRRLGYRVLYQPKAQIVHVEGATAGTDTGAGFKRFQEVNRTKFVEKQGAALAAQHPPDAALVFRARDRQPGKRILVVDHMVPLYDQDAGSVRMLAMLQILTELGHKVTFVPDNPTPIEPYTETLQQLGIEVLYGPMLIAEYLEKHVSDFDLVILSRAPIAVKYISSILARPNRPPVIFDTVDLHYLREQRRAELERTPGLAAEAALTKKWELFVAAASDMVWVVSEYEAEVLRQEDPSLRIGVIPTIHKVRHTVPPFAGRRDLLFIGSFLHPPNEPAVLYFVKEIFPLIRREIDGIRFSVVGSKVSPAVQSLASPDVLIVGYVKNVDPLFDASRVFVAPLQYGAGLKGKITQSLACGLPVVTTTIGAEGMHLTDREHALIADHPPEFVARVIELYQNEALWTRLSERGRAHVEAHFGYETVKGMLEATLRAVTR